MKIFLSYLLLCIYATIMIKPVMPTIADSFAHILNYSEHIATVHYEDGKYHVHHEYIEAAKKNSHGDIPYNNTLKKTDSSNEHIMLMTLPGLSTPAVPQDHLNSIARYLPVISLQDDFRPPIASLA